MTDNDKPEISLKRVPDKDQSNESEKPHFEFEAHDAKSGLDSVTCHLSRQNQQGEWEAVADYKSGDSLKAGVYLIKVTALDKRGNSAEAESRMTVVADPAQPEDPENPQDPSELKVEFNYANPLIVLVGTPAEKITAKLSAKVNGQPVDIKLVGADLNSVGNYAAKYQLLEKGTDKVLSEHAVQVMVRKPAEPSVDPSADSSNPKPGTKPGTGLYWPKQSQDQSQLGQQAAVAQAAVGKATEQAEQEASALAGKQAQRRLPVTGEAYPTLPLFSAVLLLGVLLLARKKLH